MSFRICFPRFAFIYYLQCTGYLVWGRSAGDEDRIISVRHIICLFCIGKGSRRNEIYLRCQSIGSNYFREERGIRASNALLSHVLSVPVIGVVAPGAPGAPPVVSPYIDVGKSEFNFDLGERHFSACSRCHSNLDISRDWHSFKAGVSIEESQLEGFQSFLFPSDGTRPTYAIIHDDASRQSEGIRQ
ncbi:hypothetical protein FN846DRAFT_537707 [Sphaerosporella brunnea]|uniref:Uncharacterized protein n=1 Tax=Sphaerosporella brunnea TaxID=1250544 RepID=A0A5J5EF79_9PEZI|nr:hypothetical protein FN846DRAFT_537707 [Sphaerosporella brunnea]